MFQKTAAAFAATILAIACVAPAVAHHSYAMFDRNKKMTLAGTVSRVQYTNPHASVFVDVRDARGNTKTYWLECSSPNELRRWGWKVNSVKAGDRVTAEIFLLRDGRPGGLLYKLTMADGRQFHAH